MCGIAGVLSPNPNEASSDVVKDMLAQIRYRGPDECGIYKNREACIGNVRLSIIDIESGQQPLSNDDRSLWIAYNGEVFNYIEIRTELEKVGYNFKTNSDTEVVLKAYEHYGKDCLLKFNGQFAIAIWDKKQKELFLARDRVGIRPLYYAQKEGVFIFGSEIKSILEHPKINAELDFNAIKDVYGFWTNINPETCFKGIFELPPGHYISVKHGGIKVRKYWQQEFKGHYNYKPNQVKEASEEFLDLLEDSIRLRLRSDVPVAAYLSGGIDSSATTYMIKKVAASHLNTFSIGFAEKEFDEQKYQSEVSSFLNTRHKAFECNNTDIAESFKEVIWHTETPILRTAPSPMYLLSKNVHQENIKVVVTGEGADEIFGGYNIFKESAIRHFWAREPNSSLRPLLLKKLYPYIPQLQKQNGKMLKFFFGYKLNDTNNPFYSHLLRWSNSSKISNLLSKDLEIEEFNPNKASKLFSGSLDSLDPLEMAQAIEARIFMSGYLLSSQGDRMAMANSVEGRYPFLDHRIIEFGSQLHPELKLRGLNEKYLLKYSMKGKIPESVLNRSKQAYRAPIAQSFLSEGTPAYINELFSETYIRRSGIFDINKISALFLRLEKNPGSELDNMSLAGALSTLLLHDTFILNKRKVQVNMDDCRIIKE